MKKLIALCLAIMLVFAAMPVIGVTAANIGKFVVSAPETAALGETFDVAINIANNPGIVSAKVLVAYDSNVLEFVSKAEGAFAGVSYSPETRNPFIVNWVDTIHGLNTTNGALTTLTFKVKDGAPLGQTPITLSFNPNDVYDSNFDNVDFTTVDGCVDIISCRHTNTKTTPAVDSTCIAQGHGEYVTCLDCGRIIEGSNELLPLSDHNYAEIADSTYLKSAATFTKKAVYYKSCSVCGVKGTKTFEYGELLFYESAPQFVVSTQDALRGETVDVTVSLKNNPGIISAKVNVSYDADVLELVSKEDGEFAGVAYGPTSNNPFVINWVDGIHPNNTTNGVLSTLTFRVKDGAQLGQSPITLMYDPEDVFDDNFDNVGFAIANGCVNVILCQHNNTETTPAVASTCIAHGHGEYVTCLDCGKIIEGSNELLPLSDHTYAEIADSTYLKSAATYIKRAVYYTSCSVCGVTGTGTFEYGEKRPVTDDSPQFVISTQDALRGETIEVTVSLKNNPGIVSAKVNVSYDADVLELINATAGEFIGVAYGPTTNNPFVINWVDSIHGLNTTNGVLSTLIFKVKDGAQLGQSSITLTYDPDDVFDSNFDNVDFAPIDGYVDVILCRHTNTETTPAVASTCITHGHGEYVTCLDCGEIIEGSDEPLPLSDHDWSHKDGICATCGKECEHNWVDDECSICGKKKYEPGDVNGDGKVNNKDLGLLMQHLNGWKVEIIGDDGDVNGDGKVNNKDYGLIMQFTNGWDITLK